MCRNFILPETGKPCLLFCPIQFAQLIVPYPQPLVHSGLLFPLAGALCFAFMTIRMEDTTVMDYLGYATRHFVTSQKYYEWR